MLRSIAKLNIARNVISVNQRNISTTQRLNEIFKVQVSELANAKNTTLTFDSCFFFKFQG